MKGDSDAMASIIRRKYRDAATGRTKRCQHYVVQYREAGKADEPVPSAASS